MSDKKGLGLSGSICVTDVPKELYKTAKNGKKYLNLTIFVSDEADQYGNHGSITLPQTAEEREAKVKKQYIGNVKGFWSGGTDFQFEESKPAEKKAVAVEDDGDLPF